MNARFVRLVLALVFGLAMAGPETHVCPVHSPAPAPHHQDSGGGQGGHQETEHCTCPQVCCPSVIPVVAPGPSACWAATPPPVLTVDVQAARTLFLPSRKHLLPFALAPPLSLA